MSGISSAAIRDLEAAFPTAARQGTSDDAVDGLVPQVVVYPASTEEVAEALAVAGRHGLAVTARGGGTKLDWGSPPERLGLVIDVSRMSRIVEHASGDWVVRAEAGMTLRALQGALESTRQRLAIDEVVPGSTLGGVVSTRACGPLRYGHGSVRDLLLGVKVVRADGTVARAGSKVVKNVAGYDLAKLFTGAYGTLGVVTELTFKLHPVPEARLFVSATYPTPADAGSALEAVLRSKDAPGAIEISRPGARAGMQLCVLVEGRPASARMRADQLSHLMGRGETSVHPPAWWASLPGPVVLKLTTVASAVALVARAVGEACTEHGLEPADLRGSAGSGVLYLGLPAQTNAGQLAPFIDQLRRSTSSAHSHVTLLRAPAAAKQGVDVWGPVPGIELMQRVKERFDPTRRLSPGRFVGGI